MYPADEVWSFEVPMPAEGGVRFRIEKLRWRDEQRGREYEFGLYGVRDIPTG